MHVHVSKFVERQTPNSRFSHFDGSWDEVVAKVIANWENQKPGYRDGVILVPVHPKCFYSCVVELAAGMPLKATYEPRREGEEPRLHVGLDVEDYEAAKTPATAVDVVLYASTVLAEDGDNELPNVEHNWEIISVNARLCEDDEPMAPGTLMANFFQDDGGTDTQMTDAEFVAALRKSRAYWNGKMLLG
jgi:hypothetical protein